eukprot:CFRG1035T1
MINHTLKDEKNLLNLKIELKKFELDCIKTTGKKLSKDDLVAKHPEMIKKYKQYHHFKSQEQAAEHYKEKLTSHVKSAGPPITPLDMANKFGPELSKKPKKSPYRRKAGRPQNVHGLRYTSSSLLNTEVNEEATKLPSLVVTKRSCLASSSTPSQNITSTKTQNVDKTEGGSVNVAICHTATKSNTSANDMKDQPTAQNEVVPAMPYTTDSVLSAIATVEMMDGAKEISVVKGEGPVLGLGSGVVSRRTVGGKLTASAPLLFGKASDIGRRSTHFKYVFETNIKRTEQKRLEQKERDEFIVKYDIDDTRNANDDTTPFHVLGATTSNTQRESDFMIDGENVDISEWNNVEPSSYLAGSPVKSESATTKKITQKTYKIKNKLVSNNFVRMDLRKNVRGAQRNTPAFLAHKSASKKHGNSKANKKWGADKKGAAARNLGTNENLDSSDDDAYLGNHRTVGPSGSQTFNAVYDQQHFSCTKPLNDSFEDLGLDEVMIPVMRDDQAPLAFLNEDELYPCIDEKHDDNANVHSKSPSSPICAVSGASILTNELVSDENSRINTSFNDGKGHTEGMENPVEKLTNDFGVLESEIGGEDTLNVDKNVNMRTSVIDSNMTGNEVVNTQKADEDVIDGSVNSTQKIGAHRVKQARCMHNDTQPFIKSRQKIQTDEHALVEDEHDTRNIRVNDGGLSVEDVGVRKRSLQEQWDGRDGSGTESESESEGDIDGHKKMKRLQRNSNITSAQCKAGVKFKISLGNMKSVESNSAINIESDNMQIGAEKNLQMGRGGQRKARPIASKEEHFSGSESLGEIESDISEYSNSDAHATCSESDESEREMPEEVSDEECAVNAKEMRKMRKHEQSKSESHLSSRYVLKKKKIELLGTSTKYERGVSDVTSHIEDKRPKGNEQTKPAQRRKKLKQTDLSNLANNPNQALKYVYGFDEFRPGQKMAVSRICKGESTLVVQPTGSGKSLCYQLPAFIRSLEEQSLCIVVCPLVSLMHDQVKRLPKSISGACLNSTQTQKSKKKIVDDIRKGLIRVLYVSPELINTKGFADMVAGKEWSKGKLIPCSPFPPISFVCIDEAHCVSEWSHNFRPAYLRLGKVIRDELAVKCVLALTATATISTLNSIMKCFGIPPAGVIRGVMVPRNLSLCASYETRKDQAILQLLRLPEFSGPVIIYCTRQYETERVANIVRNSGCEAEFYHGGLSDRDRKRVQFKFMSDKLRIICCTIAFGMGLDKPNIGGVIHYNMPKSIENYVQEVGRAGRDGRSSFCHMLLSKNDIWWLRSRAHSDSVDANTLLLFITEVFHLDEISAEADKVGLLSIEDAEHKYDISESALYTLLCKLEMHTQNFISVLPSMNSVCTLRVPPLSLKTLAETNMFARAVQSVAKLNSVSHTIKIKDLAERLGADLRKIPEWLRDMAFGHKMGIDFSNKAFAYRINIRPGRAQTADIHQHLLRCMGTLEHCGRRKVEVMYGIMEKAATDNRQVTELYGDTESAARTREIMSDDIRKMCSLYFQSVAEIKEINGKGTVIPAVDVFANSLRLNELILSDSDREHMENVLRSFVGKHGNYVKSGRAVARILHGIDSPCHQASHWRQQMDWGKYTHIDFNVLCTMAMEEFARQRQARHRL